MNETKKIGLACFVGGALCVLVALLVAPALWWLGIGAGIAGGYMAYEFRQILLTIPRAWKVAHRGSGATYSGIIAFGRTVGSRAQQLGSWIAFEVECFFSEPHPLTYPAAVLGTLLWLPIPLILLPWAYATAYATAKPTPSSVLVIIFAALMLVLAQVIAQVLFVGLAFLGARFAERCFWYPFIDDGRFRARERLLELGYTETTITTTNMVRWAVKGVGVAFLFLIWTWWVWTLYGIFWLFLPFLFRLGWQLFRLIHSHKRVLCAIDGTLGGTIAYLWLGYPGMSLGQQIVLVVFDGFLGAGLGILNWELVSKRWLKVANI